MYNKQRPQLSSREDDHELADAGWLPLELKLYFEAVGVGLECLGNEEGAESDRVI